MISINVFTVSYYYALYVFMHDPYFIFKGTNEARAAIASLYSCEGKSPLSVNDVVIASGCSGALDIAISAVLDEGDNILLPSPGFPL